MSKILIKNIKGLLQVRETPSAPLRGEEMRKLPMLENAFLAIEDDEIIAFGYMEDWGGITDWRDLEVIDAEGAFVMPGFVDSHTHLVFAAFREDEFVDRIKGLTYQEIAEKGGGILNSAKKLRGLDEDALYEQAMERLHRLAKEGTTAIEIKSGYGLSLESEIKILRVIKRIKENTPLSVKATFLGAHAFPKEYKNDPEAYINIIINEMLPIVEKEKLADYIDVFCEKGYFSVSQTERILKAGIAIGLAPKIHVNQFNALGGVKMAIENKALSVDHLEELTNADIDALKHSTTIATVLPSCSFFLNIPYAPVRKMIDEGIAVSIASDYNPGSTPSGNISFLLSLACIKQKLTPEESINAVTVNASFAMGVEKTHGTIAIGKKANIIITKPISSIAYLPYSFGENCIGRVFVSGQEIK